MADNYTYKYASGAEVTLRATELGSIADGDQKFVTHVALDDGTGEAVDLTETEIVDSDGNSVGVSPLGKIKIEDAMIVEALGAMTKELKIMNMHLSILTDTTIEKGDL